MKLIHSSIKGRRQGSWEEIRWSVGTESKLQSTHLPPQIPTICHNVWSWPQHLRTSVDTTLTWNTNAMTTATIQAFNFKLRQRAREKLQDLIQNRREILIAQLCVGFPSSGKAAKEKALCTQCTCEIPLIRLMCQSLASFFLFPKLHSCKWVVRRLHMEIDLCHVIDSQQPLFCYDQNRKELDLSVEFSTTSVSHWSQQQGKSSFSGTLNRLCFPLLTTAWNSIFQWNSRQPLFYIDQNHKELDLSVEFLTAFVL